MAIQWMSEKRVSKMRRETGLPIEAISVRGGVDHTKVLYLTGGVELYLGKDNAVSLRRGPAEAS